ncbi:DUF413 domain-containing protein [Pseudoalteromonas sp. SR44-5]|uniref:DUF413 domain-containing protein n=1 Tax=unclassified Pseudoalteromonas TaxID=194690 RepID=UPI00160197A4|nr:MULTISPECIES: DUF413 domain-containing protein [unclassified Pseudoalteromonas]MBB1335312.1 DUF413 domain-containing protein [Pseudoalteromonas sp. SR41-6]MBB1368623.1 DUF413 domain-containing protein [Pseudoalteromonas sp. SR44-5]MBB1460772.1 DUF413 domain-containing protein [Pseudoalteromonas sp. SG41-8]MBB1470072.1 DUF413 domain-containing protein [Pseudoalteromonas sp. SG41-5]
MKESEHIIQARRKEYLAGKDIEGFTPEEYKLINSKGYWLKALASGDLEPQTEAQANFIEVCNGNREPESEYEKAWVKYQSLNIAFLMSKKIAQGNFEIIQMLSQELPDLVFDKLINYLRKEEDECSDSISRLKMQKMIIKIRDIQNKGKSQTRFNITNWGGLHDFGL